MATVKISSAFIPGIKSKESPSGFETDQNLVEIEKDKARKWQADDPSHRLVVTQSGSENGVRGTKVTREIIAPDGSNG